MSFFGVEIRKIKEVKNHPNGDNISIAKLEGLEFQFITKRNEFAIGQDVLYFPVDSILPENILQKLGMIGKLSGKNKDRIKTVKLRGEISMGIVCPPSLFLTKEEQLKSSEELTSILNIKKYEPPPVFSQDAELHPLPKSYSKYDIESSDRYASVLLSLLNKDVVIHEKLEGMNFSIVKDNSNNVFVNQRSFSIIEKPGKEHEFWKISRKLNLIDSLLKISGDIAIYGELCGPAIQGNIYSLKEVELFVFDVKVNFKWLGYQEMCHFLNNHFPNLKKVPLIYEGQLSNFLDGKTIQTKSSGISLLNNKQLREGIVIKPMVEEYHSELGRLILKQRDPIYLSKTDN